MIVCVLQNHQREVEIFDENLAHISTWLYQTEIRLDETEKLPTAEREKVVKVGDTRPPDTLWRHSKYFCYASMLLDLSEMVSFSFCISLRRLC